MKTALENSPGWQHPGPQRQKPRIISSFCSFLIWTTSLWSVQEWLLSKERERHSWGGKEPDGKFREPSINSSFVWFEQSHANLHPVAFCPTAEAGARRTCEGKLAVGAWWIWKEKSGAFNSQTSDTGKFLPVSTERVGDDGWCFSPVWVCSSFRSVVVMDRAHGLLTPFCIWRCWGSPVRLHQYIYSPRANKANCSP